MYHRGTTNRFRHNPDRRKPTASTPAPPLGPWIETVSLGDLSQLASSLLPTARITNAELLASYNWLDKKRPTIIVPGAPPKWTPPQDEPRLREDDGVYYRDKNASRFAAHPMEPAVQAILQLNPKPTSKKVDVVACGSTLGNLLRLVRGEDRSFRMLVENVDGVVHLIRRENSPQEVIDGVRGYGHTFPEAYTSWDPAIRGSTSHQRIVRYTFGGLNYIVRYEGDGYLPDKLKKAPKSSKPYGEKEANNFEDLVASLVDSSLQQEVPQLSSNLQVEQGGFDVPQSAVFDLKTRAAFKKGWDIVSEELPRMWVAQIPYFVLAYHTRGTFDDIEIIDVSSKMQEWEKSMSKELSKLAALVHHIVETVRRSPEVRLELCREGLAGLELRAQTPKLTSVLSENIMKKWRSWLHHEDTSKDVKSLEKDGHADDDGCLSWGDDSADFTACSSECGYCGRCTY